MEKLRAELASSSATGIEALIEANFVLMSYPEARIFSTILIEAVIPGSTIRETYAEQYVAMRTLYADYLRSIDTPVANPELVAVTLLAGTLGINLQHRLDPDNVDRRSAVTELESIYARAMASTATSGHENPAAHENP
jgi:TetR/AcrR family acrAB operon transcriptional repressor